MIDILKDILIDSRFREGVAWQRCQFSTDTTIFSTGEIGDTFYFIESGNVRVLGDVEIDTHRHVQPGFCDLHAGDIFGESCLFASHLQTTSVKTLTQSTLLLIDGQRLNVFLDDHPIQGYLFFRALFQILMGRLVFAHNRVENLLAWGLKAHNIDQHLS